MTVSDLKPIIAELEFFAGFAPQHLELVTGCAKNVVFEPDEFLFREGEPAESFYILRTGRVALEIIAPGKNRITIQTCSEGDPVGWSWLVGTHRWRYAGRALKHTRAIAFDGTCLRTKCDHDYELGYRLLQRVSGVIATRLEATRLQLLDLYAVS